MEGAFSHRIPRSFATVGGMCRLARRGEFKILPGMSKKLPKKGSGKKEGFERAARKGALATLTNMA